MPLTEDTRVQARAIIDRYPRSRSALLPMLHLVQAEEGYVSAQGVELCAQELGLTKAEVGAVATFYTMYKRRPCGEFLVSVCTNLSCQLLGGEEVYERLSRHLGVGHDETTPDGTITLEHAECLAACDFAPVLTVNYEFYDNVTPDTALDLVGQLQAGARPHPTRGDDLVTFGEISLELAGFPRGGDASLAGRQAAAGDTRAHPDAPTPVDSRGSEPLQPAHTGYGVPGGVTERVLPDSAAAATYGATPPTVDAGATPLSAASSPAPGEDPAVPPSAPPTSAPPTSASPTSQHPES